jgi:hypothetical protein
VTASVGSRSQMGSTLGGRGRPAWSMWRSPMPRLRRRATLPERAMVRVASPPPLRPTPAVVSTQQGGTRGALQHDFAAGHTLKTEQAGDRPGTRQRRRSRLRLLLSTLRGADRCERDIPKIRNCENGIDWFRVKHIRMIRHRLTKNRALRRGPSTSRRLKYATIPSAPCPRDRWGRSRRQ